jgi:hypothetical protein
MKTIAFSLRFPEKEISRWASRYSYASDYELESVIAPAAQARGYFTKSEFLALCHWKTPRTGPRCAENEENFVKEVTRIALTSPNERLRIEVLTLLRGVDWPTASTILHFGYKDQYPILDFRALWSLGIGTVPYRDFAFWSSYTNYCQLARRARVTMRVIDRALWQYSKEHQGD